MDKLEEEIRRVQKEAADLRKRAEAKELELKALQKAATLRPAPVDHSFMSGIFSGGPPPPPIDVVFDDAIDQSDSDDQVERKGGRQPGAISKKWRAILNDIFVNEPVDVEQVVLLAAVHGVALQPASAQSRMTRYIELGYIAASGAGEYRVTADAIDRFGLKRDPRKGK